MTSRVTIGRAEHSDATALSALTGRLHGHERSVEHWEWKYRSNPAEPILTSLAKADDRIVGQIAGVPVRIRVRDQLLRASQEVDVYIDEDYRKGPTFFRLYKKRLELNLESGFALNYTITIPQSAQIAGKVMKFVAPVPRMVKMLNAKPYFRRKVPIRLLADFVAAIANRTLTVLPSGWDAVPTGMRFEPIARFDARFDRLWAEIENDYPVRVVKDAQYLNWRYCDIPDEQYESIALVAAESGAVLGFIVLAQKTGESVRGLIVDIVTPRSDDGQIGRHLLACALRWFDEKGADSVVCWMFRHCHVYPLLSEASFRLREAKGHNFMVNVTQLPELVAFLEHVVDKAENWYLVQGDHASAL